jgi:hypothetical protein
MQSTPTRHRAATFAALLLLATTSAHAERWAVAEGAQGEWRSTWSLRASSGEFKMLMRNGNNQVTAEGLFIRSGNLVAIARTKSSDGNDCNYTGTITGNTVAGTVFCGSGGPYRWSAVIAPLDN